LVHALHHRQWEIIEPFHEKLISLLRIYYFVGGMPEAVKTYIDSKDLEEVRTIQHAIIVGYENDFAKYAPNNIVPKIRLVWQSILGQLAKENRKFIYGQLKKGARAKDFEEAINWLTNAGLVLKSTQISKPSIPLKSYANYDIFKLFLLDIGLLNAMGNINSQILLNKNQLLTEFKGAFTEQYVAQELKLRFDLVYWSAENATAEIDFIIQKELDVKPIEVKAEENLKAKSLKVYREKYNSPNGIRTSMSPYRKEEWLENLPLYAVMTL
jgi:predicted AAA+ superfamily ATPase